MRFLFVLDPLEKLDLKWDTSLTILRELNRRGHKTFAADAPDFRIEGKNVWVRANEAATKFVKTSHRYIYSAAKVYNAGEFHLIFIRKNPPFDGAYLNLTYVLDLAARRVPVINDPQGIRDTNEKLSILQFPRWIPETLVAGSPQQILEFQRKIGSALVIKPLDEKGGKGVFLLKPKERAGRLKLEKATGEGKKFVLAQRFLKNTFAPGEKRILILNGKFAAVYEKRPPGDDFRANLGLSGSTFHSASLTKREEKLVRDVGPFLLKRKIYFAGIDVLNERLIEINVTSPAGITEIMFLQPETRLVEKVAGFLENCAARE